MSGLNCGFNPSILSKIELSKVQENSKYLYKNRDEYAIHQYDEYDKEMTKDDKCAVSMTNAQ